MNWYLEPFRKYATFGGRATRAEYWTFSLINALVGVLLMVIDNALGLAAKNGLGPLYGIYCVATLIPAIAVSVRRLHDTNRSGWWLLIGAIPLLGSIVLLVFMLQGSKPENQYGPDPHALSVQSQSQEETSAVSRNL